MSHMQCSPHLRVVGHGKDLLDVGNYPTLASHWGGKARM